MPCPAGQGYTWAAQLVAQLMGALKRRRLVESFIEDYAAQFGRAELTLHPLRHRELVATIGREVLLTIAAQMQSKFPGYLSAPRKPHKHKGRKKQGSPPATRYGHLPARDSSAARAFLQELLAALAQAMQWDMPEMEEFRCDLELYAHLTLRAGKPRKAGDSPEGPFADRCALLLDPSMLEEARRAAGKFQVELERTTEKILATVLSSRELAI